MEKSDRRVKFTQLWLERIEAKGPQDEYLDKDRRGLYFRVGGSMKVWYCRYRRKSDRKARIVKLGKFPDLGLADARKECARVQREVELGADPASDKKEAIREAQQAVRDAQLENTFAQLADKYVAHVRTIKQNRTWQGAEVDIAKYLLPAWGELKAKQIVKADVLALTEAIVAEGHKRNANKIHSLISAIFKYAYVRDIVEKNPCYGLPKPGGKDNDRGDRPLEHSEVRAFWKAIGGEDWADLFKLWLLTGQRMCEVAGMEWSDVNMETMVWTIPAPPDNYVRPEGESFDKYTKNKLAHRVPLVGMAAEIIRRLYANRNPDVSFVFPGHKHGQFIHQFQKPVARIKAVSGIEDFHIKQLRTTVATRMREAGVDRIVVDAVLNHKPVGIIAVYDKHDLEKEKFAALLKWDRALTGILHPKTVRPKVESISA